MAKTWKQIMDESGKVPIEQSMKDEQEFLKAKGMTYSQFMLTEEYKAVCKEKTDKRFSMPPTVKVLLKK